VFCSQDISQITVSGVTGGTAVYTYAVVVGGTAATSRSVYQQSSTSVDTSNNFTNLGCVKDANGCIAINVLW
jgi:hypothetical protein